MLSQVVVLFYPCCLVRLQDDAAGVNGFVNEDAGQGGEVVGVFGSEVAAGASLAAVSLNLGMTLQVVGQTVGHDGTLLDDVHALRHVLVDFVNERG